MYLYLDESGDLGFDFGGKKPSKYFVITLLACNNIQSAKCIKKATERTLKNKIHISSKNKNTHELKGTNTNLNVKTYLFNSAAKNNSWKIYSIILDKRNIANKLSTPMDKHRMYNVLANHLLRKVNFSQAITVNLFVDRSKNRSGISEFDDLLKTSLGTILPLNVNVKISHVSSHKSHGIQTVDLFCWGIFRKHEFDDEAWYNIFKHKIVHEQVFSIKKTAPIATLLL